MQALSLTLEDGTTQVTGEDPAAPLSSAHVDTNSIRTRGATLFVIPGGTTYDSIAVEGELPGGVWVVAKGPGIKSVDGTQQDLSIDVESPGIYILGGDYLAIRLTPTGGSDYVPAVPDDPGPGSPEVPASTLSAGLILPSREFFPF